jgi:hypothetical protein
MAETPRLQAKRKFVMPVPVFAGMNLPPWTRGAGIQSGGAAINEAKAVFPLWSRRIRHSTGGGMTELEVVDFQSTVNEPLVL